MTTAEKITQEIIDWNISEGSKDDYLEDAWRNFREDLEWSSGEKGITLPSGNATFVKSFGGEGKGEEYWVIFKVGEELFKVDGYYSSWDGVSWDGAELYKVAPVEVTVIEYQKIDD